ncbi:PhoH family protein [Kocuria rosea]|uniref:PhoH family protein n=1 Tax=Kocuria rosea TaxID=1275 RepID=UPI00119E2439|nr:PhoH family protein [Kocuria rosea]MEB2526411.1 PhoH family protein [Kocuria rosea]MEB2619027.1 PhoH family protein [Kocuria rosea]
MSISKKQERITDISAPLGAGVRSYVIDTSVLLSDPRAILRFAEHQVVLPVIVITELEGKRHDPELGYFARQALRLLDDLRVEHGGLNRPVPLGDQGGSLVVELNHVSDTVLPVSFRLKDNDSLILAVALSLANEGKDVCIVSKDLPMRVKASALGLEAEEYRAEWVGSDVEWSGTAALEVPDDVVDRLYGGEAVVVPGAEELPANTGLTLHSVRGSALARVRADGSARVVRGDRDVFGVHGRSAEQRLAIDLLLDPEVGIVSLGGRAGTGKSALALCAGLETVMERREHRKVMVFRPLYAVGGQELGYLPGSEEEKMNPWGQAVFDTLGALVSQEVVEEVLDRGMLEVLPLTHIRGRSLHDAFVIVDEAQSLEKNVLLTVLSRIGQNSKVVMTHDVAQRDNLRVGRHDGVTAVVEALKGHPLFGHVTLTRSERSPIAALVTEVLGDLDS